MDMPTPSNDEATAALARIRDSHVFSTKSRLSDLLRFLVMRSVEGTEIKESVILVDHFKRSVEAKDSTNIVRSNVNHLRTALADYYDHEGFDDEVRIAVPRRTYNAVISYSGISRERAELERIKQQIKERERELDRRHTELEHRIGDFEARQSKVERRAAAARNVTNTKLRNLESKLKELERKATKANTEAKKREARIVEAVREHSQSVICAMDDTGF